MKHHSRNLSKKYIWIVLLLVGVIALFTISFSMLKDTKGSDLDNTVTEKESGVKVVKKSKKIREYVEREKERVIEEIDINKEVSSVLVNDENKYEAHLFNYATGEEITLDKIIKEDKITEFKEKIKELLYLKYPTFIADVLALNDKRNEYFLKENELIIYYYDYVITPAVNEVLSLKVNYNEIKDFLNLNVNLDSEYQNEDGSIINIEKKLISITFDDGPSVLTKNLVDILNNNKANATFFMVTNKLNAYKDTVLYVHNNGNEIGYHSLAHKNFKKQTIEEIQNEYINSNEILKSITGTELKLTRPPYGSINNEIKDAFNTAFILWNVDTEDWRKHDSEYLKNYVLEHAKEGDIILFHDTYKTSIEAIEKLLPELYVRGFQVVTVSELAKAYNTEITSHQTYRYFIKSSQFHQN